MADLEDFDFALEKTLSGLSGLGISLKLRSEQKQAVRALLSRRDLFTILYYTILYYTILYYTILYYAMLCYAILYYTTLHYTTLHYTTLHYTILYYTILYYTILYYTILYYICNICTQATSQKFPKRRKNKNSAFRHYG